MTGKNLFTISYLLNNDSVSVTAIATNTFLKKEYNGAPYVQIEDIDVDIIESYIEQSLGFILLDRGGMAVTESMLMFLVDCGVHKNLFRKMTVNGKSNILWQIISKSGYKLLNCELDAAPGSNVFLGPLQGIDLELCSISNLPIGCILGREENQELIFSKELYYELQKKFDVSELFTILPLYDEPMVNIFNGDFTTTTTPNFDLISSRYLDCLRGKELLALLKYAHKNSIRNLGTESYNRLKKIKLPLSDKLCALKLFKKLPEK